MLFIILIFYHAYMIFFLCSSSSHGSSHCGGHSVYLAGLSKFPDFGTRCISEQIPSYVKHLMTFK